MVAANLPLQICPVVQISFVLQIGLSNQESCCDSVYVARPRTITLLRSKLSINPSTSGLAEAPVLCTVQIDEREIGVYSHLFCNHKGGGPPYFARSQSVSMDTMASIRGMQWEPWAGAQGCGGFDSAHVHPGNRNLPCKKRDHHVHPDQIPLPCVLLHRRLRHAPNPGRSPGKGTT